MLWGKGSPIEPGAQPPAAKNVSITTLVRIAVAVVVVGAVAWFGWNKYTEHQTAKTTAQLADRAEQSMQEYLNTDTSLSSYKVRVLRVDLNKVSDNKYEGVATVNTAQSGIEHLVPITVTNFSERMMWQAEPGAFLFLLREA